MQENMNRTAGPKVQARSKGITVHIEEHCMRDMQGWCDQTDSEVSGFGIVDVEDGHYYVRKVYFPLQYGGPGYTFIPGESRARLNYSMNKRFQEQNPKLSLVEAMEQSPANKVKLWFHTHPTFGTFWSGTDDNEAQSQMEYHGDWSLSIVLNHKRDILVRTDIMKPVRITIDELPIKIIDSTSKPIKRNYRKDVLKWVHPLSEMFPPEKPRIISIKKPLSSLWDREDSDDSSDSEIIEAMTSSDKDRYINYGGVSMRMSSFVALMECTCPDNDCEECKEILQVKGTCES